MFIQPYIWGIHVSYIYMKATLFNRNKFKSITKEKKRDKVEGKKEAYLKNKPQQEYNNQ